MQHRKVTSVLNKPLSNRFARIEHLEMLAEGKYMVLQPGWAFKVSVTFSLVESWH